MKRAYLIVFLGKYQDGRIYDVGNDPCFDNPPTWGICRPNIRRAVRSGDILVFVARIDKEYYLKGYMEVGEKIDYPMALKRYRKRQNVILSKKVDKERDVQWRYRPLQSYWQQKYGNRIPHFLLEIESDGVQYFQNPKDDHEIDNWKCRRIYHCNKNQFKECVDKRRCIKKSASLTAASYSNYVVSDSNNWCDLDELRITYRELATYSKLPLKLATPYGQHNVRRVDEQIGSILEYIAKRSEQFTKNK